MLQAMNIAPGPSPSLSPALPKPRASQPATKKRKAVDIDGDDRQAALARVEAKLMVKP